MNINAKNQNRMKKFFLFLLAAAIFVSAFECASAQNLVNGTRKVITVKSADNSYELPSITPRRSMSAPFLKDGKNMVTLYYYEGMKEIKVGLVEVTLKNGKAVITEDHFKPAKAVEKPAFDDDERELPNLNLPAGYYTQLVIKNSSSHSIIILTGPFAKLALAPGQSAVQAVSYPLGQAIIVVKLDFEADASEANKGRKYRQAVISTIITLDQKFLEITDASLSQLGGKPLYRRVQNNFMPFQFVSGPWVGDALKLGEMSMKAPLIKGFNSFAVQWVDKNGIKWQADAEVLVTSGTKIIKINEAMLKNVMMVKQ